MMARARRKPHYDVHEDAERHLWASASPWQLKKDADTEIRPREDTVGAMPSWKVYCRGLQASGGTISTAIGHAAPVGAGIGPPRPLLRANP